MKNVVALISLIVVFFAGRKGWALYQKIRHAQRIQIGVKKFKILNLSTSLKSQIVLTIGNFSPSTFTIDQININAYTPEGELLAKQADPLPNPLTLQPNQNTALPLAYTINSGLLLTQLHKIGGASSVLANQITEGKSGLPIILKGFIISGSLSTEITQPLTV